MSKEDPKPEERLRRMQAMFADDRAILAEDYAHFTGISPQTGVRLFLRKAGRTCFQVRPLKRVTHRAACGFSSDGRGVQVPGNPSCVFRV